MVIQSPSEVVLSDTSNISNISLYNPLYDLLVIRWNGTRPGGLVGLVNQTAWIPPYMLNIVPVVLSLIVTRSSIWFIACLRLRWRGCGRPGYAVSMLSRFLLPRAQGYFTSNGKWYFKHQEKSFLRGPTECKALHSSVISG